MKNIKCMRIIGFIILLFSIYSCDSELHMYLPQGPQGNEGLSAYEVWVKEVGNGNIDWNKDRTDITNFFLYLKGKDGKDGQSGTNGQNGKDGQNGQSAYDLWKEEVTKGVEDPHNPGHEWDKTKITVQDFWYFLTGAKGQDGANGKDGANGTNGQNGSNGQNGTDGQNGSNGADGKSAYVLWTEEVAKGLEDPHNPGQEWPKDQTTIDDFWKYLRGADGKDGEDGSPAEIGQPGKDVIIVKGKPNVISQYVAQEFSEFVRWTDGGVAFIVYDDQGSVSPGAKVKGLPGVQDPNKVYTADANGTFVVPKEDLPVDKTATERFGVTTEVEYLKSTGETVKEVSAKNTYVPNRMQIRMRLSSNPYLYSYYAYIYLYPVIERKTDPTSDWKQIPSYLGDLYQTVYAYELSDPNDPESFTESSNIFDQGGIGISQSYAISVDRLIKPSKYIKSTDHLWDGNDHYFNLALNSYYGEKPHANAVIKMAPIQCIPLIKNVKAYNYNASLNIFSRIEGEFDIADTNIDYNLFFKSSYNKESKNISGKTFDYYSPIVEDIDNMKISPEFEIQFNLSENKANNSLSKGAINVPTFRVNTPYLNTEVVLGQDTYSANKHFLWFRQIGTLKFDPEGSNTLKIVGIKNSYYDFPDILVQQITE